MAASQEGPGSAAAVPFDVGAIVPSTRDLLQAIATRRRSLALVGLVDGGAPDEEAARLHELDISALAFAAPGPAMLSGARATKTVPSLSLAAIRERDDALSARYHGADGVCVDALLPVDDWDHLAKIARTMRMLPLALVESTEGAAAAVKAGARAVLIRGATTEGVLAVAEAIPRGLTIVAEVVGAEAGALLPLVGRVDAAVVSAAVHASPEFADFVREVDP